MKTAITELLGIDVPILAFTHCRDVVVAVSKAGGFGVLGAAGHSDKGLEIDLDWIENELGDPRYPKLQQIMQAARKTVTTWTAADLGLDAATVGATGARLRLERLEQPPAGGAVQIMAGDTPEEQARALAAALREARII